MLIGRRELLRLFGVGATIVPVVRGFASMDSSATLVEIPKVELVQPAMLASPLDLSGAGEIQVTIRNCSGSYTFSASYFNLEGVQESVDVTSLDQPNRHSLRGVQNLDFTMRGRLLHSSPVVVQSL